MIARSVLPAALALVVIGISGTAQAAVRMYSGSLIIHAFGNDTSTGSTFPYSKAIVTGIPLAGNCNTAPYHTHETITLPTYPTSASPTQAIVFTIPKYGGAIPDIDTNGDMIPDVVSGCQAATLAEGDPLTGSGSNLTTGMISTVRTSLNPRGFTLPKSALAKVASGSAAVYSPFLFSLHYGDLKNEAGVFGKNLGDGTIPTITRGSGAVRASVRQTAGKNKFGGVMRLLGTYSSHEGYFYNGSISVARYTWLFNYLGDAEPQGTSVGVVTGGHVVSASRPDHDHYANPHTQNYVYAEVFKWTTGIVRVTATGFFPTVLERNGFDNRTGRGAGQVQMVSPMLTHWVGAGETRSSSIGVMKLTFAPEPEQGMVLGAGAAVLGLLFRSTRK